MFPVQMNLNDKVFVFGMLRTVLAIYRDSDGDPVYKMSGGDCIQVHPWDLYNIAMPINSPHLRKIGAISEYV